MGLLIAFVVVLLWAGSLAAGLLLIGPSLNVFALLVYLPVQTWLFTGLFITAHDAMHGTVSSSPAVNRFVGYLTTFLYAAMWYPKLLAKHKLHHRFPGTPDDPDYNSGGQNFFRWWFGFMLQYITVWQVLVMALLFNLGLIWFTEIQLIVLWVVPAIASTFQLFYFGTYQPHRLPHHEQMMPHRARSQKKLHGWALVSCYFFGYHFEHHASPRTPWWQLYKIRA